LVVDVRVVEHDFGGNTTNVQARPAKGPTLLYTCGLGKNKPWIKPKPNDEERPNT
jgi:hypothetical protein